MPCDRIVSVTDTIISKSSVQFRRVGRNWSQAQLAERAGISRAAVSAIEGGRLSPSVATALALAKVLECTVEELFSSDPSPKSISPEWAWTPKTEGARYWEASVGNRHLLFPVEATALNATAHDGVWQKAILRERPSVPPNRTLTLASCDPAAGILAAEYARETGLRLIVFPRSGSAALELLKEGLIHVAALHRSTQDQPGRNAETVRERLGAGFHLVRMAAWEEGIALAVDDRTRAVASVARQTKRWAARERGSGARECLEELLNGRRFAGREVHGHGSVAEAVRDGWAGAGVCVRFSAAEAGLNFLPVRSEAVDLCFAASFQRDPRLQALLRLLRSRPYRRLLSELPGYDSRQTGELIAV
jgi:molybdate-binding protein/transcriptional regulator with XRE-family HTH domain